MTEKEQLKLIYVLKIGNNSKGEGLYEFLFSKRFDEIDYEGWGWDLMPANGNAEPPDEDFVDKTLFLKTDRFELKCLHELDDRCYLDGYHGIHAIAYELYDPQERDFESDYDMIYDDLPLLIFHYGMNQQEVEDQLFQRDVVLKKDQFVHSKNIEMRF
jgi:hypothetical protein